MSDSGTGEPWGWITAAGTALVGVITTVAAALVRRNRERRTDRNEDQKRWQEQQDYLTGQLRDALKEMRAQLKAAQGKLGELEEAHLRCVQAEAALKVKDDMQEQQIAELKAHIAELRAEVAHLRGEGPCKIT